MNYQETIAYLEDIKKYGSIPGLESITELLDRMGNPQDQLKIIHIAGTNGKGSILAMLESVLRANGYRTGRYHSPVLFDVKEAFQVNEAWISMEQLCVEIEKVKAAAESMVKAGFAHPTSFEVETAAAFSYFKDADVDIVLLETGMGGRLDATNVIKNPLVEILASISMDHMQFLGDTIEKIAAEKAGIIKKESNVVLYPSSEVVEGVVKRVCDEQMASYTMALEKHITIEEHPFGKQQFSYVSASGRSWEHMKIRLLGEHQIKNAITALEVMECLMKSLSLEEKKIYEGMEQAKWPGRLEIIGEKPMIIRDGAHNEDAAKQLSVFLEKNFTNKRIFYIIGVLRDKEYEKVLAQMAPYGTAVYTVTPDNPRGLGAEALAECARQYYPQVYAVGNVKKAVTMAMEAAEPEDMILIFGSLSFMKETEELKNDGTISKGCQS